MVNQNHDGGWFHKYRKRLEEPSDGGQTDRMMVRQVLTSIWMSDLDNGAKITLTECFPVDV